MAERYQVRGLRIWDSETDTYSGFFAKAENAEWLIRHRDVSKFPFKPLAEWEADKPVSDPVNEHRYQVIGRRILDSQTDTWSKVWHDETTAALIANWCNAANGGDVHFLSISEWDAVEKRVSDAVNHPPHYQGKVECIDAIEAALGNDGFVACCRGNAIKYIYRAGRKGDSVEDLRKAAWYLDRAIKTLEK
jgi:hypothetical protein